MAPLSRILIIAFALAAGVGAAVFCGNLLLAAPLGAGLFVLLSQFRSQDAAKAHFRERDEALPLLLSAIPKLRVGLPVDDAFLAAAAEAPTTTGAAVAGYCAKARQGLGEQARQTASGGAMVAAIIALIDGARRHGGEVTRPFASLANMIEMDQRLRRKQEVATLHVRAQANGLVFIAVAILGFASFASWDSLSFLRETQDGRLMVVGSIAMMVWGYVVLNALTARIAND